MKYKKNEELCIHCDCCEGVDEETAFKLCPTQAIEKVNKPEVEDFPTEDRFH